MIITAQECDCLDDNLMQTCWVYVHKKSWEQQRQMYVQTCQGWGGEGTEWEEKGCRFLPPTPSPPNYFCHFFMIGGMKGDKVAF